MSSFYHHLIDEGVFDRNPAERMRAGGRDAAQPTPAVSEGDFARGGIHQPLPRLG